MTEAEQERAEIVAWLKRRDFWLKLGMMKRLHGAFLMIFAPVKVGMAFWSKQADAIEALAHKQPTQ